MQGLLFIDNFSINIPVVQFGHYYIIWKSSNLDSISSWLPAFSTLKFLVTGSSIVFEFINKGRQKVFCGKLLT